ncbi:hypothetical protein SAMN04488074_106133 [Lentzea albidocapillata subsp. violacea]|uniref:HTH cro/C1-type domain-containing protein n=1 Tax=Lentzea albidocapillata subsp. violacea TaxID=128104 RepID=A0A1G9D3T9_9PSEU|nr:helix-turn-helix transcriptional regulator [Lentzea albidocapillata]SDK58579.1 hypothetical protein SAMN04488074_106133 [Lentzea albidocapillata subsp. violacea]
MPRRKSTLLGREFGKRVRAIIDQMNMPHSKLAEKVGWDQSKMSDMVRGKGGVTELEVVQLLAYCRVTPAEFSSMIELYRETRMNGYLQIPDDGIPDQVRILIEQEVLANAITVWASLLIPGHLQTVDYMRALVEGGTTNDAVDYEEVIKARIERRRLFHHSRKFVFYIAESALRLPVGGPAVMKDQLIHLLGVADRSYVTVRIIPSALGAHAGASGSFLQLRYEKFEPVIFIESKTCCLFLEDKSSLDIYSSVLKLLDAQALDEQESKELIKSILT